MRCMFECFFTIALLCSCACAFTACQEAMDFATEQDLAEYLGRISPRYRVYADRLWRSGVASAGELATGNVDTLLEAGIAHRLHAEHIKVKAAESVSGLGADGLQHTLPMPFEQEVQRQLKRLQEQMQQQMQQNQDIQETLRRYKRDKLDDKTRALCEQSVLLLTEIVHTHPEQQQQQQQQGKPNSGISAGGNGGGEGNEASIAAGLLAGGSAASDGGSADQSGCSTHGCTARGAVGTAVLVDGSVVVTAMHNLASNTAIVAAVRPPATGTDRLHFTLQLQHGDESLDIALLNIAQQQQQQQPEQQPKQTLPQHLEGLKLWGGDPQELTHQDGPQLFLACFFVKLHQLEQLPEFGSRVRFTSADAMYQQRSKAPVVQGEQLPRGLRQPSSNRQWHSRCHSCCGCQWLARTGKQGL